MKTLIATISVCLLITCAQAQGNLQSPRLVRLAKEIATAGPEAVNTFREEFKKQGTPLIEPIPEDTAHLWVTFVWFAKEPVRNVVVFSGLTNYAYTRAVLPDIQMARLEGTNVWFKTFKVRKDARFAYQLSVNDSLVPEEDETDDSARRARLRSDPLNDVAPDSFSQDEKAWDEYGSVIREFVKRPRPPIRFYLEAGVFENTYHPSVLIANRHLRDVLLAKGYSVQYDEFAGHHSPVNLRGSLATALMFVLTIPGSR